MENTPIFRGFNQSQLDYLYNNQAACPNGEKIFADMQEKSAKLYGSVKVQKNIPYGPSPRECFDFFKSDEQYAPTVLFLHVGYWSHCNKEDFAFVADGMLKSGFNVILGEYNEAPNITMTGIVAEIKKLLDYLHQNMSQFNITANKFVLSGHSAGGHLTCVLRDHQLVSHAMPISALVDLYPISLSYLNNKLKLTDLEIQQFSPLKHVKLGVPTYVHNGSSELMELIRHSLEYAEALFAVGNKVVYQQIEGCNHFTELNEFSYPEGQLCRALQSLITL